MRTVKQPGVAPRFSPTLCVTHACNLNCIYCYQKHDTKTRMSFETATRCIDWIFNNVPASMENIEIGFIGGEPLLEFELIRRVVEYTKSVFRPHRYVFYATTNGTVMTDEMKLWCSDHREEFVLALSIDGDRETHNHNRSGSFDKIDLDFFLRNYPEQSVKMTLTDYSLPRLAKNIIFLHERGFRHIGGVNFFEGDFDWDKPDYLSVLKQQLKLLSDYYVQHPDIPLNQMLDKHLDLCESKNRERKKWCGIGDGAVFFDCDGTRYPCPFATPMSFSQDELASMLHTNFNDANEFIDEGCYSSCYIYPVCPTCSAANYLTEKCFKTKNKCKCNIQKLVSLFIGDIVARRILQNPSMFPKKKLFYTIQAIKTIRSKYGYLLTKDS